MKRALVETVQGKWASSAADDSIIVLPASETASWQRLRLEPTEMLFGV